MDENAGGKIVATVFRAVDVELEFLLGCLAVGDIEFGLEGVGESGGERFALGGFCGCCGSGLGERGRGEREEGEKKKGGARSSHGSAVTVDVIGRLQRKRACQGEVKAVRNVGAREC